jgi:hypothetical protein
MSQITEVAGGNYHSPEAFHAACNRIAWECYRNAEALRFMAAVLQAALENLDKLEPNKKWLAKGPAKEVGDHIRRAAAAQEACGRQALAAWERFRDKILNPPIAAANQGPPTTAPNPNDPNVFRGMPQPNRDHRRTA